MRRVIATTFVAAVTILLAYAAAGAGVAQADPRANTCDVEGLWGGFYAGTGGTAGPVTFEIFNQAPPAPEDDDGSESFALASAMASGLGNAGEGDKYHWRFETVLATGATAKGHGFLFVEASTGLATFVVAGQGEHVLRGNFTLTGRGTVDCADGRATSANVTMIHVSYQDGTEEDGSVPAMARCDEPSELCQTPD